MLLNPTLSAQTADERIGITVGCDADGKYTFQTRRGRYIPEVPDGRPYTVGKAEGAGHFVVEKAANGHFTIVNSVNTAYGFDATASPRRSPRHAVTVCSLCIFNAGTSRFL